MSINGPSGLRQGHRAPKVCRLEPFLSTVSSRPDLARSVKVVILQECLINALDFDQSRKAFDACARALGSSARDIYHKSYGTHSSIIKRAFFRGTAPPQDMALDDFIPTIASELLSILVSILTNLSHLGIEEGFLTPNTLEFDVLGINSIPLKTFESDRALEHLLSRSTGLKTLVTLGLGIFPNMPTVRNLHLRSQNAISPKFISGCLSACSGTLATLSYTAVYTDFSSVYKCIDIPRLHASLKSLHLDMGFTTDWHYRSVPMPSLKNFTKVKTLLIHTFPLYGTDFAWCDEPLFVGVSLVEVLPSNITSLFLAEEQPTLSGRLVKDLQHLAGEKSDRFPFLREVKTNTKVNDEHLPILFDKVGIELVYQELSRCSWNCMANILLRYPDLEEYNERHNGCYMPLPGEISDDDL
ncbi:hypothetical protein IL306_003244 [Fusarium sp. DS 682]|nr:hypothetical protein IL306_003244 [Fusarium sp. DS 682]